MTWSKNIIYHHIHVQGLAFNHHKLDDHKLNNHKLNKLNLNGNGYNYINNEERWDKRDNSDKGRGSRHVCVSSSRYVFFYITF